MERNNNYEIEARVELPVLAGVSAMQDIVVNIDPDGREGRLFGLVLDTLGGTYRIELENCRLLTIEEQDNMTFDDYCDGISIPSVVVPLATAPEIVGGNTINEPEYAMRALLSIIDRYRFSYMQMEQGENLFVQAGSILTYCVMPTNSNEPCRIRFVKTAENGRTYNMKRYPEGEDDIDEYDLSGGGDYLLRTGEIPNGTELIGTMDGEEHIFESNSLIVGHDVPSSAVIHLIVKRKSMPLYFGLRGDHKYEGLVRQITSPLTADLVRFINEGNNELISILQTTDYNSDLPTINRLRLNPGDFDGDGVYPSVCLRAKVRDFAINGEYGDTTLELHDIDPDKGDNCEIQGTGSEFYMQGEFARRLTLNGSFAEVFIKPDQINERAILDIQHMEARGFYCVWPGAFENDTIEVKGEGSGEFYLEGDVKQMHIKGSFVRVETRGERDKIGLYGNTDMNTLSITNTENFTVDLEGNLPLMLGELTAIVKRDKNSLYDFLSSLMINSVFTGMASLCIGFEIAEGYSAQDWDTLLKEVIQYFATGLNLRQNRAFVDLSGMWWMFNDDQDVRASQTYAEAVVRTSNSEYVRIILPYGIELESVAQ